MSGAKPVLKKGIKTLIDEALAKTQGISADDAQARIGDPDTVFVDLRDVRELERDGLIPGAFHAPRGMLEFWVDPESPYAKPQFQQDKTFVFYCASGWRSALSTLVVQEMGLPKVAHITEGFKGWAAAGGDVAAKE